MVHTGSSTASARVPNIAANKGAAQGFVSRLVMQTVFDVLESQGRGALLPDTVISSILGQLAVNITYEPLLCKDVILNPMTDTVGMKEQKCIVVVNTVTAICTGTKGRRNVYADAQGCDENARSRKLYINFGNYHDYKYHHVKLVENDVAKCSKQSNSNVGIGPICIALLLGICRCQLKLRLKCDMFQFNRHIKPIDIVTLQKE
ncbi:hypothetical protein KIN20_010965 [Parelaphostrongylus tenuis]|uniref:Uncharacterized protein n=1 Tax=Parelaphostrongylus tenuis TaxID=148309 RepID=A0AAD5MZQ4_PARTN|nr:hypothetical protein KIN20_010965 [Parelaphostrongylus tenuis]